MAKLSDILRERGYVHQHTSETLEEITDGDKRTLYLGIDPSAESLHIGNLVGLLVLRRFLEDGHKVIILTGGGTGMIGDPGGKSEERNLLDEETVERNSKAVAAQIRTVFGSTDFIEVNNAEWLHDVRLLEFLRDVGKHFTVNAMIKKDIVRDRLEKESPISFTEFSYSLLQGYDFLHLNEEYSCDLQVGGSDQWSNILAGVEFIRRKSEKTVYALTWPLVVNKSTGKKFGKSEDGAVWLDPAKTTPFQFYQFFYNVDDESAEDLLLKMTLLSGEEIASIVEKHRADPSARVAQIALAEAVTTLVHGAETAVKMKDVSAVLFSNAPIPTELTKTLAEFAPHTEVSVGASLADVLISAGLASSKREARQFLTDGAVSIGGKTVSDEAISESHFSDGVAILRRGKRNASVLVLK